MNALLIGVLVTFAIAIFALGAMWIVGPWRPRSRHLGSSLGYAAVKNPEATAWGIGNRRDRH